MATENLYDVYVLNVTGMGSNAVYSAGGSGPIASDASLIDDNTSIGSSTNILGDTIYDSFSVNSYSSPNTPGGSDLITDDGGTVPLLYRGYITSVYQGVTYYAAVGEDVDTGNFFLFAPSGTPVGAIENQTFGFVKNVVGVPSTEFVIKAEAPFCFVEGTVLRTEFGDERVDKLKVGDLVLTASGAARPIRWIGRSVVASKFADKLRMMPIRIKAGALAENVPSRDLLVSPGHAIMVEDMLVHASALVNGASILREERMPLVFTYYHVELDSHDLLLAENTPAESFLEAVSDIRLDNFPDRAELASETATLEMPHARIKAARQLPLSVRAAIEARIAVVSAGMSAAA